MSYRLTSSTRHQVEVILAQSEKDWGTAAQARYANLIVTAFGIIADDPVGPLSTPIDRLDVWHFHLRSARRRTPPTLRVHDPRHVVVYRIVSNGTVEILGLVHDRQDLARAARRARLLADR